MRSHGYRTDLALVHDSGFTGFAADASTGVLHFFEKSGFYRSLTVELGCGSGTMSKFLVQKGDQVHGVDQSRAMIRLAELNVPGAHFVVGSLWDFHIPPCDAIVSIGECLNYEFGKPNTLRRLKTLFSRVYLALQLDGVFVFDVLCASKRVLSLHTQFLKQNNDWSVAVDSMETQYSVTRNITSFLKVGKLFRRSTEVHKLRKYERATIIALLKQCGFVVQVRREYSEKSLGANHIVVFTTKRLKAARSSSHA